MNRPFALLIVLICVAACHRQTLAQQEAITESKPAKADTMQIPSEAEALRADPEYAAAFRDLITLPGYPADPDKAARLGEMKLRQYRGLMHRDPPKFIRQAMLFAASPPGETDPTMHGMRFFGLMKLFDLDKNPPLLILSILPILNAPDPKIARLVKAIQEQVESETENPDFSNYGHILAGYNNRKIDPPRQLMLYMLRKSPGQALSAIAHEIPASPTTPTTVRHLLVAEHQIADYLWKKKNQFLNGDGSDLVTAQRELARLLDLPHWWVHLYVAEILDKNPELRTPDLTARLRKDDDPDVKALAAKWDKTDPARPKPKE